MKKKISKRDSLKLRKQPLVSINIPTYNSEKTLGKTLRSILSQSYKNLEIMIIDSYSNDKTLEIANKYNIKIVKCRGRLLESRIAGVKASKGDYILLLDSDQILQVTSIKRAVDKMKLYDYLWFYERSYNSNKFLPSLYDADRILTQKYLEEEVVLPRFFKRKMLLKAMNNIPKQFIDIIGAQDHIIIDEEIKKLSRKMGCVEFAVQHIEPDSFIKLFKKQYRWGKTTGSLYNKNIYRHLITKKNKFRNFYFDEISLSLKSFILRVLRGVPYFIGFYIGRRNGN